MTNEQAKSELMQIYMSLSEEKKQALDVLMAQNCDQCEVGNPCLYCEHEFKEQADNIPEMYYPQVDGITPTVVAQADGEYDDAKYHEEHGEVVVDKAIWEDVKRALEQEPKTGHWKRNETIRLTYCSECGFGQHIDEFRTYNYCPNCGAKMIEPQESEE